MTQRLRVLWHPLAQRDVEAQVEYWVAEQLRYETALEFIEAVERALVVLSEHPEAGVLSPWPWARRRGLRLWPVSGFWNHMLFYRLPGSTIELVRVLNGARNLDLEAPPRP